MTVVLLAVSVVAAGAARAQIDLLERAPDPSEAGLDFDVEFGWGGRIMPGGRYSPIRLTIDPGERTGNFVASVNLRQDATQHAEARVPFAARAGEPVVVEPIVVAAPRPDTIVISIRDERGRLVRQRRFSNVGRDEPVPTHIGLAPRALVVGLGFEQSSGLFRAVSAGGTLNASYGSWGVVESSDPEDPWEQPALVLRALAGAPLDWAAYDSADVVVVAGESAGRMEPRALDALRTWVDAGGSLVVMGHDPGAAVEPWLPRGEAAPVTLGAVREALAPRSLASAIGAPPSVPGHAPGGDDRRFAARPIALTAEGAQAGWRLGHLIEDAEREGLIANGPVGLGVVTVVGFNPDRAAPVLDALDQVRAWRAVLSEPVLGRPADVPAEGTRPAFWRTAEREHAAARAALSALHDGELFRAVTTAGFAVIAGAGLVLVLMVGLVDMIWLKRRGWQHRSWLVALVWIGLASLAAWRVPDMIRAGDTVVSRWRMIDAIVPAGPGPSRGHMTAVSGVFVGERSQYAFSGMHPEAWLRGASMLDEWEAQRLFSDLILVQRESPGAARAGSQPVMLGQGISTYRAFLELSPVADGPWASVRGTGDDDDSFAVTVVGLPSDAEVLGAHIHVGGRWRLLRDREVEAGTLRARAGAALAARAAPPLWSRVSEAGDGPGVGLGMPGSLAELPRAGPRARSLLARSRGAWAIVLVEASSREPSLGLAGLGDRVDELPVVSRERVVYRLAVPLSEAP